MNMTEVDEMFHNKAKAVGIETFRKFIVHLPENQEIKLSVHLRKVTRIELNSTINKVLPCLYLYTRLMFNMMRLQDQKEIKIHKKNFPDEKICHVGLTLDGVYEFPQKNIDVIFDTIITTITEYINTPEEDQLDFLITKYDKVYKGYITPFYWIPLQWIHITGDLIRANPFDYANLKPARNPINYNVNAIYQLITGYAKSLL